MDLKEYIFKNKLRKNHMEKNFFMGKKYFFLHSMTYEEFFSLIYFLSIVRK